MKLAVVVPTRTGFGERGTYNRQEIGLAKALTAVGNEVVVVRSSDKVEFEESTLNDGSVLREYYRPSLRIQSHGIFSAKFLSDLHLDGMIVLGDIQLCVPYLYRWCRRHKVCFWPYLGTLQSNRHRSNPFNAWIAKRNMKVYAACHCLAKTPQIRDILVSGGAKSIGLMPVGLDTDELLSPSEDLRVQARQELGYSATDNVVCFVGNLMDYKKPLDALEIFARVSSTVDAKLLVVGHGPLQTEFDEKVRALGISGKLQHLQRVNQRDMWRIYCASDVFINLNDAEIFGMAIMESLFYGVPVVAYEAPGPSFLIEGENDGYLISPEDRQDRFVHAVLSLISSKHSHDGQHRTTERFSWDARLAASGYPWPCSP